MSETVDSSLKTAVKGTALVFSGMAGGILLWFVIKVVIVRSIPLHELGLYTLAMTVGGVLAAIATLGVSEGAARNVAAFLGEGRPEDAGAVARAALRVGLASSLAMSVLLYALSGPAARHVFYKPEIAAPLRVVALFIPFSVMTGIVSNILRGHGIVRPKVYYQDIGQPLYFLALVGVLALLRGLTHMNLLYAFTASAALVLLCIGSYGYRKLGLDPFSPAGAGRARQLLRFSLPLMVAGMASLVLTWTDTLMLGRYASAEQVGIYNVSISLARLLLFVLSALGFIFLPLAGEMHARGQRDELKRTYQVLTKWIFSATLPLFFVLFFFPEMTITFLFGQRFVDAALPLRLLALGFIFHVFLGANGMLLVAQGKTAAIMKIGALAALLNVVLNYALIKRLGYGVTGAAAASLATYLFSNLTTSLVLYRHSGIHPLTTRHLRPAAGAAAIGLVIYAAAKSLPLHFWMLPLYFALFLGGYGLSLLVTGSLDREDIFLFEAVSARTGLRMEFLRKLIGRFARE